MYSVVNCVHVAPSHFLRLVTKRYPPLIIFHSDITNSSPFLSLSSSRFPYFLFCQYNITSLFYISFFPILLSYKTLVIQQVTISGRLYFSDGSISGFVSLKLPTEQLFMSNPRKLYCTRRKFDCFIVNLFISPNPKRS